MLPEHQALLNKVMQAKLQVAQLQNALLTMETHLHAGNTAAVAAQLQSNALLSTVLSQAGQAPGASSSGGGKSGAGKADVNSFHIFKYQDKSSAGLF